MLKDKEKGITFAYFKVSDLYSFVMICFYSGTFCHKNIFLLSYSSVKIQKKWLYMMWMFISTWLLHLVLLQTLI